MLITAAHISLKIDLTISRSTTLGFGRGGVVSHPAIVSVSSKATDRNFMISPNPLVSGRGRFDECNCDGLQESVITAIQNYKLQFYDGEDRSQMKRRAKSSEKNRSLALSPDCATGHS